MTQTLGDFVLNQDRFPQLDTFFERFKASSYQNLNAKERRDQIHLALYALINQAPEPCFLLSAILDFIARVAREELVERYHFSHFELWLNQFSGLTREENLRIRSKIIGKQVPREEYQILFPIGMGKYYSGPHYVTAHGSPDIDTTIASFWGWADAFGARVTEGLHLWNVPGGAPSAQVEVEQLFYQVFGKEIFHHLAKNYTSLLVSGIDLLSQKGVIHKNTDVSMLSIDHERSQNAIILVDEQGYYLGDWRNFDFEGIRQVVELFHLCLRWFENHLQTRLVALFTKVEVTRGDFEAFLNHIVQIAIRECRPVENMSIKQRQHLQDYLQKVLGVKEGLASSFEAFAKEMERQGVAVFSGSLQFLASLKQSDLFDGTGKLVENRPVLFKKLEEVIARVDAALHHVDQYVDRLAISLKIQSEVFSNQSESIHYRADVTEMRSKMGSDPFLTVTVGDAEGRLIPMGVIHAEELHKPVLGTVSLRDFCNRDETKIPSYLEVISVIDHHKTQLTSLTPPVAHISDSQSSNALVAELAFVINDRYSMGGMTLDEIKKQMKEVGKNLDSTANKRIMRRLLQRLMHGEKLGTFFIDPNREFLEYLHFLYAILDDTDLLTKISMRDVICMASLLNRLKSLMVKQEVEVVDFDDIPKDGNFVKVAAQRILQNQDMFSLCCRIYKAKEEAVKENLELCAQGKPSSFFSDTKEQNGCCRVGQAKLYASNFPVYQKHAERLRQLWFVGAELLNQEKPEVDFHLQMISTVAGAEDLFSGKPCEYAHQDEIWIWAAPTEQAATHLRSFLNAFKGLPLLNHIQMEVDFLGKNSTELERLFRESFLPVPIRRTEGVASPIIVLRFKAGSINSRKAMISPFLPKLVS